MMRSRSFHPGRRGLVLLAVLVVVTIAALTGSTAMYLAGAEMASAGSSLRRIQARALAWSGVQAVMAELADQRDALLDGHEPQLTQAWELFERPEGRGVVRLVAMASGLAESESAKLDVNDATEEMLAKVPGLDADRARAIVAARTKGPLASIASLAGAKGLEDLNLDAFTPAGEEAPESSTATPSPARYLTVFSFDPNAQVGVGDNGSEHRGELRLNLNTAWSEELGRAIDKRFGDGAGAAVKRIMDRGTTFKTMSDVVSAARQAGLPAEAWVSILDAFTVTEDPFLCGRVDVNRAPAEVLATIPGISEAAASKIVEARPGLDSESRRSVIWLVTQGILTADQFAQAVDYITCRSLQWRVRVEAGFAAAGPGGDDLPASEAALTDRVVLEAVIDIASERPRVAYLRDVTLAETAATLAAELAAEAFPFDEPVTPDLAEAGTVDAPEAAEPDGRGLDLSSGLDRGFADLNLGGSSPAANSSTTAPEMGPPPETSSVRAAQPGVDRRVGRWTTGQNQGVRP